MAHFAKVESGTVTQVIVAEQDFIDGLPDKDKWVQTSYNTRGGKHYAPDSNTEDSGTPFRKNYAGIGFIYDSEKDAFYKPQPHPSWILNETSCIWEPPNNKLPPQDGKSYVWKEDVQDWVEV